MRRIGCRALVVGADSSILSRPLPDGVLPVSFAPFSQVFPRCAAVIHHAGIGTVGQTLRAGLPALVAPWGVDQFFHADRLVRAGVGRWLSRRAYTVERVTRVLDELLTDRRYRDRARAMAAAIAAEDGVGALCDALETVLRAGPVAPA